MIYPVDSAIHATFELPGPDLHINYPCIPSIYESEGEGRVHLFEKGACLILWPRFGGRR